ncbi:hypothetical protein [Allobranchiibius huperziae]|uniref:Zn-dependent protease with chaperone function n=1 Tax=Allobranchiibius huperziae TaxID=1874116 RepID=A0A853DLP2_9MICO|nr:hypothetical protein [Allobranchiibius huperziae]NYJ75045.1 Zn-dependent protease with chaperone function [Allobranchiibius huperziae]
MRTIGRGQRTRATEGGARRAGAAAGVVLAAMLLGGCDGSGPGGGVHTSTGSVSSRSATSSRSSAPSAATGTVVLSTAGLQVSGSVGTTQLAQVLAEARVARTWVARTWPTQVAAAGTVRVQVAANAAQFARLRGGVPESDDLAASTTASGEVVIGQAVMQGLTAQGQRVVLAHEITHVVLRQTTRTGLARWVVEGSAEYTAYRWTGLSLGAACPTLAADVRADRLPAGPPPDAAFSGGQQQRAYQDAHAYMSFLVDRFGENAWKQFVLATSSGSTDAFGADFDGATTTGLRAAYAAFLRHTVG